MFDTTIAIILLDELETWQKLNITAFLMSGIIGRYSELIGKEYLDKSANKYLALSQQPAVILEADTTKIVKIHERVISHSIASALYIRDMFSTYNDDDNRNTVLKYNPSELPLVGIAIREEKKLVNKVTKGAKLHP